MIRLSPARRASLQRLGLPLFVVFSAAVIVLGKADGTLFEALRNSAADTAAPMLGAVSRPIASLSRLADGVKDWVAVYRDNARLTQENSLLLQWQAAALNLEAENKRLRGLLRLVPSGATSYVTARVIANSGGAYVRSLMIDAGRRDGVAPGQAVETGAGLVGRITEAGEQTARVLLTSDLNSNIPVFIEGRREVRAILSGDNTERPYLRFYPARAGIRIGDRIVTSGVGGLFPPRLPVGVVAGFEGKLARVEPYADASQAAYLRVVDYGRAAPPAPTAAARGSAAGVAPPSVGGL
ncbi:MAG TPA: rod shape-determining protein MreC [Stellaceae bacterium]|nr:rod shape-determining protein MreC [Stellaceae bacterium]